MLAGLAGVTCCGGAAAVAAAGAAAGAGAGAGSATCIGSKPNRKYQQSVFACFFLTLCFAGSGGAAVA